MSTDLKTIQSTSSAFKLKGRLFTLTALQILSSDLDELKNQLFIQIQQAPSFFQNAPIVVDLRQLNEQQQRISIPDLQQVLLDCHLLPIAFNGANEEQQAAASALNIPILHAQEKPTKSNTSETPSASHMHGDELSQTKLITTPIRSGQQVYAPHGDLIILAPVGHGAEVLASGHIHIYGTLRGRALAGVNGNMEARIFCQSMEAELVSIAGHYMISEDIEKCEWKVATEVFIKEDHLHIRQLS